MLGWIVPAIPCPRPRLKLTVSTLHAMQCVHCVFLECLSLNRVAGSRIYWDNMQNV